MMAGRRSPWRNSLTLALIRLVAIGLGVSALARSAVAQVGDRIFFEPLITADANPGNTLDIIPQWTGIEHGEIVAVGFSLEKKLSTDFSIQIGDSWNDPMCEPNVLCDNIGPRRRGGGSQQDVNTFSGSAATDGMDDLEILLKYAFLKSDFHEIRIAIGADLFIPAGNPDAGADTHFYGGPILMFDKGMGDLPNHAFARWLRPFALQADIENLLEGGGNMANDVAAAWDISYSLDYLDRHVEHLRWPPYVFPLTPFAEFTYGQSVIARQVTTQPDLRVMPGIAYVADVWQFSLASSFAMNDATKANNHAGVIGMLSLSLARLFPAFKWQPWTALQGE
jgi:hypothetical protein